VNIKSVNIFIVSGPVQLTR